MYVYMYMSKRLILLLKKAAKDLLIVKCFTAISNLYMYYLGFFLIK